MIEDFGEEIFHVGREIFELVGSEFVWSGGFVFHCFDNVCHFSVRNWWAVVNV